MNEQRPLTRIEQHYRLSPGELDKKLLNQSFLEAAPVSTLSPEAAIIRYEELILQCAVLRMCPISSDPAETTIVTPQAPAFRQAVEAGLRCIAWLEQSDFFTAPASAHYHDAQPHGLLFHTLEVVNQIIDLCNCNAFKGVIKHIAIFMALVHDWCKIGIYEPYNRNVKNEETGQWEKKIAYNYKDSRWPLGHGETSAFLARKFFRISFEEELAIVHHMGAWAAQDSYHINALSQANAMCPHCLMLQTADALALGTWIQQ